MEKNVLHTEYKYFLPDIPWSERDRPSSGTISDRRLNAGLILSKRWVTYICKSIEHGLIPIYVLLAEVAMIIAQYWPNIRPSQAQPDSRLAVESYRTTFWRYRSDSTISPTAHT